MDSKTINRIEHAALRSELELKNFCEKFSGLFSVPQMNFDYENETEWGEVSDGYIQYNVSKPYEAGTLQEWDDTVPVGCNFGISFVIMAEHKYADNEEWIFENIVAKACKQLAAEFNTLVYYHRTNLIQLNKNIRRDSIFHS